MRELNNQPHSQANSTTLTHYYCVFHNTADYPLTRAMSCQYYNIQV